MSTISPPTQMREALSDLPRLDAHSNGTLMSPEEFDEVTDWDSDYRYELIQGVVIVSPAPGGGERSSNDFLGAWLRRYLEARQKEAPFDETLPEQYLALPSGSRRRADRAVWIGLGRLPRLDQDLPTIAIEFCSASRRDRRRDYEEIRNESLAVGVKEYWVIDRFQRIMTVFTPAGEVVVNAEETYRTPLLPGFELPLAQLLAAADRYSE